VGAVTAAAGTPVTGTRSHGPTMVVSLGVETRAWCANTTGATDPHAGPSAVAPRPPLPHPEAEADAQAGGGAAKHEVPPPTTQEALPMLINFLVA
jgi:hypothetical protein